MRLLNNKVPPPLVALACGLLAWLIARFTPEFAYFSTGSTMIALLLVLAGLSLDVLGLLAFRKAKTTISPLSPHRSSAIVQSGIYRFTRNPMYVGMALVLLGVCISLENPLSAVGLLAYVGYITRFQIIPEEQILLSKFGNDYARYMQSVRRWI